jgi:AraC-like DNA-binding protein
MTARAESIAAAVYDRRVDRRHGAASGSLARPSATRRRLARASTPVAPASGAGTASGDTLSDVLRTVRLTGALFFTIEASSPWCVSVPDGAVLAPVLLPRAQHVISYHVVTQGSCWGRVAAGPSVALEAGDVLVVAQGDAYAMGMGADRWKPPGDAELAFFQQMAAGALPFTIEEHGGGRESLHLVCGFLGCDLRPFNPLLRTLPRLLHLRAGSAEPNDALRSLIELTLAESREPRAGGECVRLRLSELLFVEVVRRHLAALPVEQTGWLAGLRDPGVGRALALLHQRPAQPWTLEALARDVGVSRSVLAERFTHLVGHPPMQYLARWRMQVAARLLADGVAKMAAVAFDVGYDSEAAFNRAFKKATGLPPATWRRRHAARA